MKSKRFRAGISRMKIPDESSGVADSESGMMVNNNHKDWNKEISGVYCPESTLFNL